MKNLVTLILLGFCVWCSVGAVGCGDDDDQTSDTGADSDSDSDGDADTDADADADTDTDSDTDSDADGDTDGDADGDSDSDADADSDTDSDSDADTGPETPPQPAEGSVLEGEYCYEIEHCETGLYCDSYQIATPDLDGTCQPCPGGNKWILQGTLVDFVTREPVPNVAINYSSATQTSMLGCNAISDAKVTTDDDGRFKGERNRPSSISAPIGYVARICNHAGYYPSGIGVSDPPYGCAARNRDMLVMPQDTMTAWSEMLAEDQTMVAHLPLGQKGGALGRLIDIDTNEGIAGAHLESRNGSSGAKIRYLNENMDGWTSDTTSASGFYTVVNPGLGEKFDAYMGDQKISDVEATVGSRTGMIFMVDIRIEADEKGI